MQTFMNTIKHTFNPNNIILKFKEIIFYHCFRGFFFMSPNNENE